MADSLLDGTATLQLLYGDVFYTFSGDVSIATQTTSVKAEPIAPERPSEPAQALEAPTVNRPWQPAITWKPKPNSLVLFVLQLSEFKNPVLTDLLKKIVDSLEIDAGLVGFGQIEGQVNLEEFDTMPNPYAVVFDGAVWGGAENPVMFGKREVFFSQSLARIQDEKALKMELWGYLKQLKAKLSQDER